MILILRWPMLVDQGTSTHVADLEGGYDGGIPMCIVHILKAHCIGISSRLAGDARVVCSAPNPRPPLKKNRNPKTRTLGLHPGARSSNGQYLILPNRGMTPVAQVGFT